MPRLELGDGGDSFFNMKLIRQEDGFSVEMCLRLRSTVGRSVVVLYDIIKWGDNIENAKDFIERIVSAGIWKCKMSDKSGFFSISWPRRHENACFSAAWRDEHGDINYETRVSADNVRRFQSTVRASWKHVKR